MFNDKSNDTACGAHRYRCRRWAIIYILYDNFDKLYMTQTQKTLIHTHEMHTHTQRAHHVYTEWTPIMKQLMTELNKLARVLCEMSNWFALCLYVCSEHTFFGSVFALFSCNSNSNVLFSSYRSLIMHQYCSYIHMFSFSQFIFIKKNSCNQNWFGSNER